MAHHMVGKFTIQDLRPFTPGACLPVPGAHPAVALNQGQALTAAEDLAKAGFRPRVDFAVVEWVNNDAAGTEVVARSPAHIHARAEELWKEEEAKKRKKIVVELRTSAGGISPVRFGWLIVERWRTTETRVAFRREDATEFDDLLPAHIAAYFKDLGSPSHIHLVPREVG